ncbi:MAG TPA: hypothetical protein VJX92_21360 [Methylomirabilota bacterium]|nr:hypothetical protein [Methylomirabilota bacterium]
MTELSASSAKVFDEPELRHLLSREVQRCTRYQDFLTLCLLRPGRPGESLSEVTAAAIRRIVELLRATDIVGTVGSDIVVLLVHTPDSDARLIADRIRDGVGWESLPPGEPGRTALRIGLASFPTDATSDDGLLAHALAQVQAGPREID